MNYDVAKAVSSLENDSFGLYYHENDAPIFLRKDLIKRKLGQTIASPEPEDVWYFYDEVLKKQLGQLTYFEYVHPKDRFIDEIYELATQEKIRKDVENTFNTWWRSVQEWSIYIVVGLTKEPTITSLVQFKAFINEVVTRVLKICINNRIRHKKADFFEKNALKLEHEQITLLLGVCKKVRSLLQYDKIWYGSNILGKKVEVSESQGACIASEFLTMDDFDDPRLNDTLWRSFAKETNKATACHTNYFLTNKASQL